MLNGWFQGIGFPPCARLMTHWFPPHRFASKMGIWNMSHSIGTVVILIMCGYLARYDWRLCFFVPGAIAIAGAGWLAIALRDTPESLGLPPVDGTGHADEQTEPFGSSLQRLVFANPFIWVLSFANFFVYTVRYGLLDWMPTFLTEARGIHLIGATWMTAAFEFSGALGMLCGGWLTDRVLSGRAARACVFYMLMCSIALLLFWQIPNQSWITSTVLLCAAGFFIYGPQSLIGTAVAKLATKRAAATAVGLTGLFGYLSTAVSGAGVGWLVDRYNWDAGFLVLFACSTIGMVLFVLCWPAKAHGYAVAE
jgi:OPA family glycerol-3-phosphate transporter-like MFS transporter/OPA family sugar phosphate sensor protein UhpC-like MFS transporter